MSFIYLDWSATAVPDPDILSAVQNKAASIYANPSSRHAPGKKAAELLEESRSRCASCLDVPPETIIFTSGGTESNNMIVFSLLTRQARGRVIISNLEHPSCREPVMALKRFGWDVDIARVNSAGILQPEDVEALLTTDTRMVLIMAVHNETGAIQPINEIVTRIRAFEKKNNRNIHIHCDAVQAFGKIPFTPAIFSIDSASFSAHKIGGPRGVGLLYCSKQPEFLFRGGGQEQNRRHGTENLPSIHGMSLAMEKAAINLKPRAEHATALRSYLIERLSAGKNISFIPRKSTSMPGNYSPFILSLSRPPLPGEVLVRVLSDEGFAVSTGSACSTNKKKQHGVFPIPDIDEKTVRSIIRVSTGPTTTLDDIKAFCSCIEQIRV